MKINFLETYKRLRKTWVKNPKTQVQKNKKKSKSRQQEKIDLKKEL